MRTVISIGIAGVFMLTVAHAQTKTDDRVVGTWIGAVHCLHGDGDTFVMSITRDAKGQLRGTMDWAVISVTGRGPDLPFTTLRVDGAKIRATRTEDGRVAELDAAVEDGTIVGRWRITGVDDVWSFTGKRQ